MAPALRIPARLDMDEFRQNVAEARSKVQEATDFMVKQLEKTAAKSAIFDLPSLIQNNDTARAITQKTVNAISQDLGKLTAFAIETGIPLAIENQVRSASAILTTVGIPAARGLASALLPIAARAAAVYSAYVLVRDIVHAVAHELELMVDVADKAQERGLSPETFQAFIAAAKGTQDVITTLESALDTFFQANKRRLDDSVSPLATDAEKEKWTELALAIREVRFEMDGISQGPQTFLNAGADMNQQLLGVVQTLRELHAAGQDLVALDIAEKAFGPKLADNLRTGKITIDQIANTVEQKLQSGVRDGSIFSNQTVQRAKDIDDQLKQAWHTVDQNLHPSMEALDNVALNIKSAWVDIVKLIAEGARVLTAVTTIAGTQNQEYAQLNNVLTVVNTKLRDQGLTPSQRSGLEAQQRAALSRMAVIDLRAGTLDAVPPADTSGAAATPLPRRRPTNIPEPSAASGSNDDATAFDRTTDAINRHIAAMNADAAAVGLNKTALEAMRAEMQLLQSIQRDDGEVTQEQIDKYAEFRATMSAQQALTAAGITLNKEHADSFAGISARVTEASNRLEAAKTSFEGVNDAMRFFGQETATALSNITSQTKGIDLLRTAVADLTKELINAALTGQGAFAKLLGFAPAASGGVGGIFGALAGIFRAEGGPVQAGQTYIVGEKGPEVFVPNSSGQIIPNRLAASAPSIVPNQVNGRGNSAPNIYVSITSAPTYQAGMTPTDMATIEAMQQHNTAEIRQQVQNDLKTNIRNNADFLTQ